MKLKKPTKQNSTFRMENGETSAAKHFSSKWSASIN